MGKVLCSDTFVCIIYFLFECTVDLGEPISEFFPPCMTLLCGPRNPKAPEHPLKAPSHSEQLAEMAGVRLGPAAGCGQGLWEERGGANGTESVSVNTLVIGFRSRSPFHGSSFILNRILHVRAMQTPHSLLRCEIFIA